MHTRYPYKVIISKCFHMDIHIKLWTYQNAFKYTENQKGQFALEAYQSIIDDGVQTKHYTFVCLFKACDTIDSHEHI